MAKRTPSKPPTTLPGNPLTPPPDGGAFSRVLTGILDDATARFAKVVIDPPGSTDTSKTFRRARAADLIGRIERIRRDAGLRLAEAVAPELAAAYRAGIARGLADGVPVAKAAGIAVPDGMIRGGFTAIDANALAVIVRDTVSDLTRATDATADRASKLLRKTADIGLSNEDVNKVVARGLIAGTPLAAARDLREDLRAIHGQTLTVIDRNGDPINYDVGSYAKMVVRTRTREAQVKGGHNRQAQIGLDLVRVHGRVSNSFCTAYLFKVYSLSGTSSKYPPYSKVPAIPMHPNCSKSTAPFVEALASPQQLAVGRNDDDVRAFVGIKDTAVLQRMYQDTQMRSQVAGRFQQLGVQLQVAKDGED